MLAVLSLAGCGAGAHPPTAPWCGDGVVDPGEACDEGAGNDDFGACKDDCTRETCGDGLVGPSEVCDWGERNDDRGACKTDCTAETCGDGLVGPTEGCDDGNLDDADECTSRCALRGCGDGIVRDGEACDDGNASDGDACLSTCVLARCGDGFVREGVEACDDGNLDDADGCNSSCEGPTVELGACGADGWEVLEDGAEVEMTIGPESCCSFHLCIRESSLVVDPYTILEYRIVDDRDFEWASFGVGLPASPMDWLDRGDGWLEMLDMRFMLGLTSPDDVEGRPLDVTLRLIEHDGDAFEDSRTIRLWYAWGS